MSNDENRNNLYWQTYGQNPHNAGTQQLNSPSQGGYAQSDGRAGQVWQPFAMGGGEWRTPTVVTLSDADVERLAQAVVRLLRETSSDT